MTVKECLQQLKLTLRKGDIVDDDLLDDRLILKWINDQRATWLKNEMNKGRSDEDNVRQTIDKTEMKLVNSSLYSDFSTGKVILQSVIDIPRTIELLHKDSIVSIKLTDILSEKINYIHYDRVPYAGNGIFNFDKIYAFMYRKKIHIISNKRNKKINFTKYLSITGIFENPLEVIAIQTGKDVTKDFRDLLNYDYPLSLAMWTYMQAAILETTAKLFLKPIDTENDGKGTENNN